MRRSSKEEEKEEVTALDDVSREKYQGTDRKSLKKLKARLSEERKMSGKK